MPSEREDSKKRNVAIALAGLAVVAVAVVAVVVAVPPQAPSPSSESAGEASGQVSASSQSGVIELSDGVKVATHVDEDDAEIEEAFGAKPFDEQDYENQAFENIDPRNDPAGAGEDGLGLSYYKGHRPATADEIASLSARLEGWWRPFIAESKYTCVRIHDGVCQKFSGDGQLLENICTIGQSSVIRFDEGMLSRYAAFKDEPGFFIGGLYTDENPSRREETYLLEGAFLCDETQEGSTERMEELRLSETSVNDSGYLYRIEAPDWAESDSAETAKSAGDGSGAGSDAGDGSGTDSGTGADSGASAGAGAASASKQSSSADERAAQQEIDAGRQVFTGTVVITTKGERRKELGLPSRVDDATTIAYLEFDEPRECIQSMGGGHTFAYPDCTSLGLTSPSKWKKYRGKRVMLSADVGDFDITDESVGRLYDFSGSFKLVKVCEDGSSESSGSSPYRAVGTVKL